MKYLIVNIKKKQKEGNVKQCILNKKQYTRKKSPRQTKIQTETEMSHFFLI